MELELYLRKKMLEYNKFDKGHDIRHVKDVIENSLILLKEFKELDRKICITVAVYHDLGLKVDRDRHHIHSESIVRRDTILKKFFNEEEIDIIANACKEHRASYTGKYTSIYSQIVSDADRTNNIHRMIERSYEYTKSKNKDKSSEDIYEMVYSHLCDKYGRKNGYGKYNLDISYKIFDMEDIWKILEDENKFNNLYKFIIKKVS